MIRANVNVNFDSDTKDDAEAKINAWKLHEGCQVVVSLMETMPLLVAGSTGKLSPVAAPEQPVPTPEQ